MAPKIASIGFENHKIRCIIGCLPPERIQEREILIDLTVGVDITPCIQNDDIHQAVSYVDLAKRCTQMAQENKYHLMETMAAAIIDRLLNEFPLFWVHIKIKKPQAIPSIEWSMVELKGYKE